MPFGQKNAGATYQRLVNQMFNRQIDKNMEIYVDNMHIKSNEAKTHLEDLQETFNTLRRYRMKLNPTKCVFGVLSGKFFGSMVSRRGIKANPEKVRAILDMTSPRMVKEVQRLIGRVVALNRFISKATSKCLPFFKTLKQAFQWTDECEATFQNIKEYLAKPLLLNSSIEGEDLFLYLLVSQTVVISTLIREESKVQQLVYYTSQAFQGAEAKYPRIEKMAVSLIVASRKFRPYFQAHPIIIMTN